jgi:hypothetical protein
MRDEALAGGLDIGGPQGGRRQRERPSRDEIGDVPPAIGRCTDCGAKRFGADGPCFWPERRDAGVCPVAAHIGDGAGC